MAKYPLSCRHKQTVSELFKDIIDLHIKPGAAILDPTCGERLIWKSIDINQYKITWSDLKLFDYCAFQSDYKYLPTHLHNKFDVIFFDPPYLFGVKSGKDKREDIYGGYSQSKEDLFNMISECPKYLINYLKPEGKLILKCSDQYYSKEKKFYNLSREWEDNFLNYHTYNNIYNKYKFIMLDKQIFIVHRVSPTAYQVKDRECSIQNYTYFFVFKKVLE